MNAVIRKYIGPGSKELVDLIEKHKGEVETLLSQVKGFVSYTFVRSNSGGFSITICQDQAGIDESSRAAKEWIMKNAHGIAAVTPEVTTGTAIIHL